MHLNQLLKSTTNSGFPNVDETYKCKFVKFQNIARKSDGKEFTLLVLMATDSKDNTNELTTIVQKSIDIPAEVRDEVVTVVSERREDSAYPRLTIQD